MDIAALGKRANEPIQNEVLGMIGKYNVRVSFKSDAPVSDSAGGEVPVLDSEQQATGVFTTWGRLTMANVQAETNRLGSFQENEYRLEIRGNQTWSPTKDMLVEVDDGTRQFQCNIKTYANQDMQRKFWELFIIQVQ